MRIEELRIGNYIKSDDDVICIVSRIETKDYTNWNSGDDFSLTALEINTKNNYLNIINDKWQPIQLTEEILLKCGFVKVDKLFYDDNTYINLYQFESCYISLDTYTNVFFDWIDKSVVGYETMYLHQLQNLYWCLVGKELNVNL